MSDWYSRGYRAYEEGKSVEDFPVASSKQDRSWWKAGWYKAKDDSDRLEEDNEWDISTELCPWRQFGHGCVTGHRCCKNMCAIEYFMKYR